MYARTFRKADEIRRFTITEAGSAGWEVREEQDSQVLSCIRYTDWHRLERARTNFARAAELLALSGWTEAPAYSTNR